MRLRRRSFGFEGRVGEHHVIIRRGLMSARARRQVLAEGFRPPAVLWTVEVDGVNRGARHLPPSWSLREAREEACWWLGELQKRQARRAA